MRILNEYFLTKCAFNLLQLFILLSYCIQITSGNVKMESYRAPGSSMFFPGVDEYERSTTKFYQWKVSNGGTKNGLSAGVLLFHVGAAEPSVLNKYTRRLEFFPTNGSFILHHLTSSDEGLYTLPINLRDIIIQNVQLWIVDKLSNFLILSRCSFPQPAIMLTCNVSGHPHEYQWLKDGGNISRRHRLVDGNRSLIILNDGKDDRGMYTCIAINPVSSVQAHYLLTINDLSQIRDCTLGLSISSLVTAASAFICTIISCYKAERYLQFLKYGLEILALVLLTAVLVYWIVIGEVATIIVIVLVVLCLLLIPTVLLTLMACDVISSTETSKIKNKGCEPAANLQSNLTVASCVSIAFLLALLIFHAILVNRNERRSRNRSENASANNIDKHEQVVLNEESCKFTSTDLGEEMLQTESTVLKEE